jgi:hypothetical protein
MSDAGIALVGAIIGGSLTAGSNVVLELIRGHRSKKADTARRNAEARQAARLVLEDLDSIEATIREAVKADGFWHASRTLPAASWSEYRSVLAIAFDGEPSSWRFVALAFQHADRVNWHVHRRREIAKMRGEDPSLIRLIDEDRSMLRDLFRAVRTAMNELERLTGPWGAFGRTGYVEEEEVERSVFGD